jgi:hypothetical protein
LRQVVPHSAEVYQALTILLSFNGLNGSSPFAALVQDTNGDFHRTTVGGNGYWASASSGITTELCSK